MPTLLSAVVLAAGDGKRMRSSLPKPLHPLCGRPMVLHVLDALSELELEQVVVVVGSGGTAVAKAVSEETRSKTRVRFVEQSVRRGTGDALAVGLTALDDDSDEGDVVVLPGDTPLLTPPTLAALVGRHRSADLVATLLVAEVDEPSGYGRIVRAKTGGVASVVEHGDATGDQLEIKEVNTSVYCFRRSVLAPSLRRLSTANAQGEHYLTDVVAVLASAGYKVDSLRVDDPSEAEGVNDRVQLAAAESRLRARLNRLWMSRGVTMVDPAAVYVDSSVVLEPEVVLHPGVSLAGRTVVRRGAEIGSGSRLVDTAVGENAVVSRTESRSAVIGAGARVGPFAVLEPGDEVRAGTDSGPFFLADPGRGGTFGPPGGE